MTRLILFFFLIFVSLTLFSQTCNNWLKVVNREDVVRIGDLDVPGNTITVEAMFNRTASLGTDLSGGDIVSKHTGPVDCNYLLRANQAEITTSDGYFNAAAPCGLELNKTFHVAMVYDGSTLKYYRNGFLMKQVPATGNLVQNNLITTIGDYALTPNGSQENMSGYINEVRIWNIARSQAEIRSNMNVTLPNASTQTGLIAYYTFDDLINKQGNTNRNGILGANASINQNNPTCNQFVADSCGVAVTPTTSVFPSFNIPDTVCVGASVNIGNTTTGASTYFWNFCSADLNTTIPEAVNLGNVSGNLSEPVFMDYAYVNNNYYGFLTNHIPGALIRLDFGNSLLNTPTAVNLGDFGGIIPTANGSEGIQIVQNEGKWYVIIVGGNTSQGTDPRILKIDFGINISSPTPIATDWGNVGNMEQPIDLHVFQEGVNWYGFTVNAVNNTLTRFSFSNSFDNTPTAVNLGTIGGIAYPTGIYAINEEGNWKVFITNAGGTDPNAVSSLTRLDFGTSLLNTPTGINLGNPGGILHQPRDLTIVRSCGQTIGFAVNGAQGYNDLVKLNFNNDLPSVPDAMSLGNFGQLNFPHSISKLFRVQSDVYGFITNVKDNTITRLKFSGCTNASIPNSSLQNPPAITYNSPGNYTINLSVDLGLSTQNSFCKNIVVKQCYDSIILSQDTTICIGSSIALRTVQALGYLWTPSTFLDNPAGQNPTATPNGTIKYYIDALTTTGNVITNGDFSSGNTGFTSSYNYTNSNTTDAQYFIGQSPTAWNSSLSNCGDHTTGNGNMMLINGSPLPGVEVWKQVINVTPNTDYAFSTWIEALWPPNPANLSFSINGADIGSPITASLPTCTWNQFYTTWNSGSHNTATISIVNRNTAIQENDFALDDISFSAAITFRDSITVSVEKPFIKTSNDTAICPGSPIQLNTTGTDTYIWTPVTDLSTASAGNPVATPKITTAYIVTGSSANGCIAKDTVNITLYTKPVVTISNDTQVCRNSQVLLFASGGSNYKWSPAAGLTDPDIPTPAATITGNTKYSVTVTDNNTCINTDSVYITVRPYPVFSASPGMITCQGTAVNLSAKGGNKYLWTPSGSLTAPALSATYANPFVTTTYSVYILDSVCLYDSTIAVTVIVNPVPVLSVQRSNDINCNIPISVLKVSGADSYFWTPSDGLNIITGATVESTAAITTQYKVTGTNEFGCMSTAPVVVNVTKDGVPRFIVPNAFTPNGDGKNDCFGIKRWGDAQIKQFCIFNRWGQVVFQTSNPADCWDGMYKGRLQDPGSFEYVISAVTLCGVVTRKGTLILIR